MTPHTQTVTACPSRNDGHAADGTPGDCLRTAVASIFDLDPTDVPHFVQHASWWDEMRRWARARGADFAYMRAEDLDQCTVPDGMHLVADGPSPRGPFWHCVVADAELRTVHDPHPSRAGLVDTAGFFIYCQPYDPAPAAPLALEASA